MISITIPIYNSAQFLRDCLDSILRQSYIDWECFLIDDGSTDESGIICDNYAETDSRFKPIHQDNKGVSAARNRGIEESNGDYITFVDSDDSLNPDYLDRLYAAIRQDNSDLVICGKHVYNLRSGVLIQVPSIFGTFHINKHITEAFVDMEEKNLVYCPFLKLFKKSIINEYNIRFDERINFGEDLVFCYTYLERANMITLIPDPLYNYYQHPDSLSSLFRPDSFATDYSQWTLVRSFHEKNGLWNNRVENYLFKRLWGIVYDGIFLYPKLKFPQRNYIRQVLSIPEIEELKNKQDLFECSKWIKWCIIHRISGPFRLYFKITTID